MPVELIAVDDKSTDGSLELGQRLLHSQEFEDAFEGRVRLLANDENRGAFQSINRGLALVSGDFINILNHDDLFSPGRLPRMLDSFPTLNGTDVRWGFSRATIIDETGAPMSRSSVEGSYFESIQDAIECFPSVGFSLLPHNSSISTGNILASRRLFELLGGFAPLGTVTTGTSSCARSFTRSRSTWPTPDTNTAFTERTRSGGCRRCATRKRPPYSGATSGRSPQGTSRTRSPPAPRPGQGFSESLIEVLGMKDTWRTARWS